MPPPAPNVPKLILGLVNRVRHVHIPDLPPLYSEPFVADQLHACTEALIRKWADQRAKQPANNFYTPNPGRPKLLQDRLASPTPPPVVLSYSGQPAFTIALARNPPNDEILQNMMSPLLVGFPTPPVGQQTKEGPLTERDFSLRAVECPQHKWDKVNVVGLQIEGAQQHRYHGPGILTIETALDMPGATPGGLLNSAQYQRMDDYELALMKTTSAVLKNEYGIVATTRDDRSGLWVESRWKVKRKDKAGPVRQIATVQAEQRLGVVRFSVSIHVGYPWADTLVGGWRARWGPLQHPDVNPWARLHKGSRNPNSVAKPMLVTSVVAELSGKRVDRVAERGAASAFVRWQAPDFIGVTGYDPTGKPYSKVHWTTDDGTEVAAPMGMDNYDLATAWAFQFAEQCGFPIVEQVTRPTSRQAQKQGRAAEFVERSIVGRRKEARLPPLPEVGGEVDAEDTDRTSESPGAAQGHKDVSAQAQVRRWQRYCDVVEDLLQKREAHAQKVMKDPQAELRFPQSHLKTWP